MKKMIILGLTAGIALISVNAVAGSDGQYPAANFQPKVIYIDKEAVKADEPKCKTAKPAAEKAEFDPKYPAANFQPRVIYP